MQETTKAIIYLKVSLGNGVGYDDVAHRIMSNPLVVSVYLVSGGYDLSVKVTGTQNQISRYVAEELSKIPEVRECQTAFVMMEYKQEESDLREHNV
jgi:DNA-binding Lrp family transcriptional regulator